jgi:hypothetical protein
MRPSRQPDDAQQGDRDENRQQVARRGADEGPAHDPEPQRREDRRHHDRPELGDHRDAGQRAAPR